MLCCIYTQNHEFGNATKEKNDRIKTIVEAAIEILGIKEAKADLIQMFKMLNPPNYDAQAQGD